MLETVFFRKQIYCIEESNYDRVGTFRRPRSHSAPPTEIWCPLNDSAYEDLWPAFLPGNDPELITMKVNHTHTQI